MNWKTAQIMLIINLTLSSGLRFWVLFNLNLSFSTKNNFFLKFFKLVSKIGVNNEFTNLRNIHY